VLVLALQPFPAARPVPPTQKSAPSLLSRPCWPRGSWREPFVGLSDAALEAHLGERAARLGRQIYYRIQLRRIESVAMLVAACVGIAILSEASAKDLGHLGLAIVPLQDPWALRQLHLCARDFSALTPHAGLLAQQLMEPEVAIPQVLWLAQPAAWTSRAGIAIAAQI
jgi:DNA-binding transcriptional LysR family regulator